RAVAQHVEVEGHGFCAHPADVRRYAQPVVEAGRPVELAMDGLAGEEDVVAVEHAGVGEAARPEQLRLRDLEEADVGAVEDDPGEVYVGPADVFLDDVGCSRQSRPARCDPSGKLDGAKRQRQDRTERRRAVRRARPTRGQPARRVATRRRATGATGWYG